MIACPACNAENQDGKTFCRKCGASLEPAPTTPCISCGNPLRPGLRFCNRCGVDQSPPLVEDNNATVILSPSEVSALRTAAVTAAQQAPARKSSPPAFSAADLGEETVLVDSFGVPESTRPSISAPKPDSQSQKNALLLGGATAAIAVVAVVAYMLLRDKPATDMPIPAEQPVATSEPVAMSTPVSTPTSEPVAVPVPVESPTQPETVPAESAPAAVAPPPPPPAPEPVVEEPKAPPPSPSVEPPVRKSPASKTVEAKPKARESKQSKAAAERKQAEEALKRLLGQ